MALQKYKMQIVLLSDTLIGSAEGYGAIIDKDSIFDEVGLPIIPGKRIKGLLREQAELLKQAGSLGNRIEDLFGDIGLTDKKQDYLSVSSFSLANYTENRACIRDRIKEKRTITRSEVIDHFTTLRMMTRMDEDGIAEDTSLRTFRVLKKGLVFTGELTFDSVHLEDFKNMVLLLRRIGSMRNRGLGHIRCSLSEKTATDSSTTEISGTGNKLHYSITTLEPVIITRHSDDPNMYETLQYIRGTVIQGIFAQHYLQNKSADNDFLRLIVKGGCIFSNAFPCYVGKNFLPAPFAMVREKYNQGTIRHLLLEKTEEQTTGVSSMVNIAGNQVQALTIPQEIRLHNQIEDQTRVTEDGKLFNYQSLPAGMVFKGHIYIEEDADIGTIRALIKNGAEIRIGRSATSEYGKVRFEWMTNVPENTEKTEGLKISGPVIMTLLSDTIIYNQWGFSTSDYRDMTHYLSGVQICEERECNQTKDTLPNIAAKKARIEGFLNVWKLRKPSENVFAAGSSFWLDKLPDNAEELLNKGLGERTQEGYGQVLFSTVGMQAAVKEYAEAIRFIEELPVPGEMPEIAEKVIRSVSFSRAKSIVTGQALNDVEKTSKPWPTNHLLGKLRGMAANTSTFANNLDELKEPARKQLRDAYKGGQSLYEHLKGHANHIETIDGIAALELLDLPGCGSALAQVYLEQYFTQLRRKNNKKK